MTETDRPGSCWRRTRALLTPLVVMAVALVVVLACRPPAEEGTAAVTEENFRRIELGMTRPSVEQILGRPPEDPARAYRLTYGSGYWNYRGAGGIYPNLASQDLADLRPVPPGGSLAVWPGQGPCVMVVEFDVDGKVYGVAFLEGGVPKPFRWGHLLRLGR